MYDFVVMAHCSVKNKLRRYKLITIAMILACMTANNKAFAGDIFVTDSTELKNAINSATVADTILIQNDINMSGIGSMNITGKNITIDGQSHGITSSRDFALIIKQKGNLTIKNVGQVDKDYNIISSFSNNYDKVAPWGGPITTKNNAGTVTYDENSKVTIENSVFSNNYALTDGGVLALQTLNFDIKNSVFINNSAGQEGGAIWMQGNYGNIENCYFKGNFVRDKQQNTSIGGAIANYGYYVNRPTYIDNIIGTFIENYSYNFGGAIVNRAFKSTAEINKIKGDFSSNYAIQVGGVILNAAGTINSIDGTFTKNYLLNTSTSTANVKSSTLVSNNSFGGVIANTATGGNEATNLSYIGTITGDFIGNFINTKNGKAYGGAIYNSGIIDEISGTFKDNYVFSEGTDNNLALGGAIYSTKDLTITSGKNGTLFSGNYTLLNDGDKNYNAIYIDNDTATLNLKPKSGKTIQIDDNIDGKTGYNVNIESEYGGTLKLYNDIKNANITTKNVNIDFADSKYHNYEFLSLNSTDTNYLIDFKLDNVQNNIQSDTITTNSSSGIVTLSDIHFIADIVDGGENYYNGTYKKQILFNNSDGTLQLKLGEKLQQSQHNVISTAKNDTINPITIASDKYYKSIYTGDLYSSIELATTQTSNDSIQLQISKLEWNSEVKKEILGDTFALWLELETNADKEFHIAKNQQYKINETLNTTSAGKLSVIGQSNISSVLDANNKAVFDLRKESDLTLKNVQIVSAKSDSGSVIKAINPNSSITIDNSSFVDNIAAASGGAIFNSSVGTNNTINGTFTANMAGSSGGAIFNQGNIDSISGEFISNHTTNSWATGKVVGGAIANKGGIINSINADFNGNYSDQYGGAIANFVENAVSSKINSVAGNFNNNYIVVNNAEAFGGAIYNNGTISTINGDFIGNHIAQDTLETVKAYGGAIYNAGTNGLSISGNFLDNYISVNSSSSALGGAIYTKMNTFVVADNGQNTLFKGNYVQIGNNKNNNAIYVDNVNATLTLKATNNGVISLYDNIDGVAGYDVLITGDNKGVVGLYNDINNADVKAGKVSINLVDGAIKNYTFNSLNTEAETSNIAKWNIDVNLTNGNADTITTTTDATSSKGTVLLNSFNIIGSTEADSLIIQILKNTEGNNDLQLKIADGVLKVVTDVTAIGNEVFSSKSYLKQNEGISLATTATTNDSIKFLKDGFYDALQLINQKETPYERKFVFDTAGTHTLLKNLGETKAGELSINGYSNDSSVSVIDLAGKTGFELLNEGTTININNATLKDSTSTNPVIHVKSANNTINLNNAQLKGNIVSNSNPYQLNFSGSNVNIDGTVDKAIATLNNVSTTLTFNKDTFANANFSALAGTINLQDSAINNYNIGTLTSDTNALYNIDIDAFNGKTDTITAGETSTGVVKIGSINFLNGIVPQDKNFKVQILDTDSSVLTLSLSEAVTNKLYNFGQVTETVKDEITTVVNFNDRFYESVKDFVIKGNLSVLSDNKSIGFKDEDMQKVPTAVKEQELLDSLHELSNLNANGKIFNFNTANDVYGAITDIGSVVNDLTINGVADNSKLSVIGLDNNNGFILNEGSILNISNVNLRGTNSVITNNGGNLNFYKTNIVNGILDGSGVVTNRGRLYIGASNVGLEIDNREEIYLSDGILNSKISGSSIGGSNTTYICGSVTNNAEISQNVNVQTGGSLIINAKIGNLVNSGNVTANAEYLTGDILNAQEATMKLSGVLGTVADRIVNNDGGTMLLSGTLDTAIVGTGTTKVDNSLTLATKAEISGTLDLNNGSINTSDAKYTTYNINSITGSGNATIDVDWENAKADTFNATSGDGNIALTLNGSTADIFDTKTIQITSGGVGISLAETSGTKTKTETGTKNLVANVNWSDKFGGWTREDTYSEKISAVKSEGATVNDSIKYEVNRTIVGDTVFTDNLDTLALIVQNSVDGSDKTFSTTDANAVYNVTQNLGTLADNLTISGTKSGENISTINIGEHQGITIADANKLTIKDVKVTSNGTILNATSSNAQTSIDNAQIVGNIVNAGKVNIKGNSSANNISGTGDTVIETLANAQINSLTQNTLNNKGSLIVNALEITTSASNDGTITNNGTSSVTALTNNTNATINGNGTLTISGTSTNSGNISQTILTNTGDFTNNGTLSASDKIVNSGTITTDASNINANNGIENNNSLTLNNGTLASSITGTGNTNITGTVKNNATISQDVNVASTGKLTVDANIGNLTNNGEVFANANNLTGSVNNAGTIALNGTLDKEIAGNGTTKVDNTLTLATNAAISGTLDLNNGSINTSDAKYTTYNINSITGSGNATIDVDWENAKADTFNATSGDGNIALTLNGSTADIFDTKTIQITSGGVGISLAETSGTKTKTETGTKNLVANVNWSDKFGGWTREDTYSEKISAVKSEGATVNDSIKYEVNRTIVGDTVFTDNLDTLALIVQNSVDGSDKTFSTTDANAVYNVTQNLGTLADNLTISGTKSGENISTINIGEHQGITIADANKLTIKDVKVTSNGTILNATSSNAQTSIDNAQIVGNIVNAGKVNIKGNSSANNISGTGDTVIETLANAQINSLTQNTLNNKGSLIVNALEITTSASNDGTITNNGTSSVTALTNNTNATINGNGTLTISGTSTNSGNISQTILTNTGDFTNNGTLSASDKIVNSGTITTDASNINANNGIENNNSLTLNNGTLASSITGTGNTNITGTVKNNATISQDVNVASTGKLTVDANIGNLTNNGEVFANANNLTGSVNNAGTIALTGTLNKEIAGNGTTTVYGNELTVADGAVIEGLLAVNNAQLNISALNTDNVFNNVSMNSGTLNLINDSVNNISANSFNLTGNINLLLDADLANSSMDRLPATTTVTNGLINIKGINLLSDAKNKNTYIPFAYDGFKDSVQTDITEIGKGVENLYQTTTYAPIYKYNVRYNPNDGTFLFARGGGSSSGDFNPSVLSGSVSSQAGAYTAINETFNYAFRHADFSFMPLPKRIRMGMTNRYAIQEPQVLPYKTEYSKEAGYWYQPYTTFENIHLSNGPRVDLQSYGTLVGGDSAYRELKNGWGTVTTPYIGYNGSSQHYSGISTYTNGGILGITQSFYKNNFFTALTINAGANVGESNTMYGHETFTTLMAGVASKTGYNFEFNEGRFIIQPNYMMSYSFINMFDYTNAAGVKIESDPLHTIQLHPAVKFIGNLPNGWQPYASVGMVWNLLNDTKVTANSVALPQMSIKPYVEYGVGVQKSYKDRFTGFVQVMLRNGGRNGIALSFGFKWAIGNKPVEKVHKPVECKKVVIKQVNRV